MWRGWLLIALAACTKPAQPDCTRASEALAKTIARSMDPAAAKEHSAELTKQLVDRCTNSKWSERAIRCVANTTSENTHRSCITKELTAEQQQGVQWLWPPTFDEVVEGTTGLKNAMCKCTDAVCVDKVSTAVTTFAKQLGQRGPAPKPPSERDRLHLTALGDQMAECARTALEPPPSP